MTDRDVVAELDRWLTGEWRGVLDRTTAQRARDEIVALRKQVAEQELIVRAAVAERIAFHSSGGRAEALEEAAQEAAALGDKTSARAIRALKDKR